MKSFILSFLLSLSMICIHYNQFFQKEHNQSILDLLNYHVCIVNQDNKKLSLKEQSMIKQDLYEFEVYQDMIYEDDTVIIYGYIDNEMNGKEIYKNIKTDENEIYFTYDLYRFHEDGYYIDSLCLKPTKVLYPNEDNKKTIYLPYQYYIEILKNKGINPTYLESEYMKVPIHSINDINKIENYLSETFSIHYENDLIQESIEYIKLFNKQYVFLFFLLFFISFLLFKGYDFLKISNDILLLKIIGISNQNLIKLKIYQESYDIGACCLFNMIFVLLFMNLFHLHSFVSIYLYIHFIYFVIIIVLLLIYTLILKYKAVSTLLRTQR